jgi:hypothetical protein
MAMTASAVCELLELQNFDNPDATCFRVSVNVGEGVRTALARALAIRIAQRLSEPSEYAFEEWLSRLEGGPELDEATKAELRAYVLADFARADDAEHTRLRGAVVEHLWSAIADALDGGWGRPLHVEHDHFSVIDHGPDGVSVYDSGKSELRFRLWESKRHAAKSSLTRTVTKAAKQLEVNGAEYLARISKPLQMHEDERVRLLAGRIVKLWTTRDDRSAVGVSVGMSSGGTLPGRPFRGLRTQFGFPEVARREGVIIEIDDLSGFAEEVRGILLAGIE